MSLTTIKDIASYLNISPSTVSRALRDHPDISQQTKDLVKTVAEKLDYQPNTIAQSLKNRQSNIIGVVVPQVKHYFFASIMAGITDVAYEAGYTVMICQSNDDYEREVINTQALSSHHVAGLLVSVSQSTKKFDHFKALQKRNIPLVFFDRVIDQVDASSVSIDDQQSAFMATEHLIKKGYKRIAHIGGPQHLTICTKRYQGYLDALNQYNIPLHEDLIIFEGMNEEHGNQGLIRLFNKMKAMPDSIFCVTDPVAIGVYIELKKRNIKIPQEVALVGFSDNPNASLIDPPLTTVHQPAYDIGSTATALLLDEINNKTKPKIHVKKILKTELIVRQST